MDQLDLAQATFPRAADLLTLGPGEELKDRFKVLAGRTWDGSF